MLDTRKVLTDFNLGHKNYIVNLTLSLINAEENDDCSICSAISGGAEKKAHNTPCYTVTKVLITKVQDSRTRLPIVPDSLEGEKVQKHIQEILANPAAKFVLCEECFELLWFVLDKK